MPCILVRLLVSCVALTIVCSAHHRPPPNTLLEDEQIRWGGKAADDIFGDVSAADRNRLDDRSYLEESDASISSDELLDGPPMSKRRSEGGMMSQSRGPTLSVVSPLEVLRQRLRLDRAKQLFRENQRQIVANEALLEKIGKRALIRP